MTLAPTKPPVVATAGHDSHAFYATRKGTPIGERGTWARECDVCGAALDAPQHVVSHAVADAAVLAAIDGDTARGRE